MRGGSTWTFCQKCINKPKISTSKRYCILLCLPSSSRRKSWSPSLNSDRKTNWIKANKLCRDSSSPMWKGAIWNCGSQRHMNSRGSTTWSWTLMKYVRICYCLQSCTWSMGNMISPNLTKKKPCLKTDRSLLLFSWENFFQKLNTMTGFTIKLNSKIFLICPQKKYKKNSKRKILRHNFHIFHRKIGKGSLAF